MKTIDLNTYDAAGRFDLDDETADELFDAIESRLHDLGWDVSRIEAQTDGYEQGSDEYEALAAAYRAEGY